MKSMYDSPLISIRAKSQNFFVDLKGLWSYPVFVRSESKETLWLYLVSKIITDAKTKSTFIFRPFASILTLPNSNTVIQYQSFKLGQDPFPNVLWDKPLSTFPHDSVKNLTIKEFEEKERALSNCYFEDTVLFNEQKEISDTLIHLFNELCSPHFFDFIECLAPEFYKLIKIEKDSNF